MGQGRRSRALTPEECMLWAHVARAVTPLKGRALPETPEPESPASAPSEAADPPPSPPAAHPPRPATPRLPPLAPLDRKVKTALRRGIRSVDAVIDLHGMRQDEAHGA